MAYDLIAIRKEHIDGLKRVIKDAPYGFLLNVCKSVGVSVSMDDIMGHIDKGLEYGIISTEDPEYVWKSFLVARMAIEEHLRGYDDFLKDVKATLENGLAKRILEPNEQDYLLKTFALTLLAHKKKSGDFTVDEAKAYYQELLEEDPFEENSMFALYSLMMYPLKVAICYIMKNFPIGLSMLLKKQNPDTLENRTRYLRVPFQEAFRFINGMTTFGLRRLLQDICPSYCEDELVEAIQKGDYDEFKNICRTEKLTLSTDLSESVGFIQYNFFIPLDRMFNDEIEFSVGEDGDPYLNQILYSAGIPTDQPEKLVSTIAACEDEIKELIPWAQTDEQRQDCAQAIAFFAGMYTYFDLFEIDEAEIVNKILDNPRFRGVIQMAQEAYFGKYEQWPPKSIILFSPEQRAQVERVVLKKNDPRPVQDSDLGGGVMDRDGKNMASRWMTESYQRMSDDVLVNLISKTIWPRLITQVDELKWEPKKRELPTFQKTKNQLAACILFHALELAKIAKLPKQEEQGSSYDGPYGEDDRALTGVYSTSKLRAGVTSTKKKYNDTLPLGYMAVLGMFIKESEMPGRTTSRTYLKLLNKWVKKDLEGLYDSADSKVKAKLFVAEAKEDLGPQLYLLTDNKTALRALLREWKEDLPPMFNIPI